MYVKIMIKFPWDLYRVCFQSRLKITILFSLSFSTLHLCGRKSITRPRSVETMEFLFCWKITHGTIIHIKSRPKSLQICTDFIWNSAQILPPFSFNFIRLWSKIHESRVGGLMIFLFNCEESTKICSMYENHYKIHFGLTWYYFLKLTTHLECQFHNFMRPCHNVWIMSLKCSNH